MYTDEGYIIETTGSGRTYEEQPDGSFLDVTEDVTDYEKAAGQLYAHVAGVWLSDGVNGGIIDERV